MDNIDLVPYEVYIRDIKNYKIHWHDYIEIIFVLSGSIKLIISSKEFELNERDLIFVNSGETHRIVSDNNKKNMILVTRIDLKNYDTTYKNIKNYYFKNNNEIDKKQKNNLIKLLISLYLETRTGKSIKSDEIVNNIIKTLIDEFDFINQDTKYGKNDTMMINRLHRIIGYIKENYMVNISLKEISDREDLSLYYLSHLIKDKFGMNFREYLNFLRLDNAVKLLLSTDKRLIDISFECGFSDQRYFYKQFNKIYNIGPSDFREEYRAEYKEIEVQNEIDEQFINDKLYLFLHTTSEIVENNIKTSAVSIDIDLNKRTSELNLLHRIINIKYTERFFHGYVIDNIKESLNEIKFKYVRLFDSFNNEMNEYEILLMVDKVNSLGLIPIFRLQYNKIDKEKIREKFLRVVDYLISQRPNLIKESKFEIVNNDTKGDFEKDIDFYLFFKGVKNKLYEISKKINLERTYNLNYNKNFVFDTSFMAPFLSNNLNKIDRRIFDYIDFIDTPKKAWEEKSLFYGGSGLVNCTGLKKSSYYTYFILDRLKENLVDKGDCFIATRDDRSLQVLLFNEMDNTNLNEDNSLMKKTESGSLVYENIENKKIRINIKNLERPCQIIRYRLGKNHNSAFGNWLKLGRPSVVSKELTDKINMASAPEIEFGFVKYDKDILIESNISSFEIELIEINMI